MRCPNCNSELDANGNCPNCGAHQNVQTMTDREARNYSGVTIEEEGNYQKETAYKDESNSSYHQTYQSPGGVKVRYVRLGGRSSSSGWLTKGLFALGGVAVLGFFFFVALPVLLTVLGAGIVAWLIFKFFRR